MTLIEILRLGNPKLTQEPNLKKALNPFQGDSGSGGPGCLMPGS